VFRVGSEELELDHRAVDRCPHGIAAESPGEAFGNVAHRRSYGVEVAGQLGESRKRSAGRQIVADVLDEVLEKASENAVGDQFIVINDEETLRNLLDCDRELIVCKRHDGKSLAHVYPTCQPHVTFAAMRCIAKGRIFRATGT